MSAAEESVMLVCLNTPRLRPDLDWQDVNNCRIVFN